MMARLTQYVNSLPGMSPIERKRQELVNVREEGATLWLEVMTVASQLFGTTGEFTTSATARAPFLEKRLPLDGMTLGLQTLNIAAVCLDEDFPNVVI